MKTSIVIPVFNEEQTLAEVIRRVLAVDFGAADREIIIAEDGSSDRTAAIAAEHAARYPGLVRVVSAPRNVGKGAAVRMGLAAASGEVVVLQDADLELDPTDLPLVVGPVLEGRLPVVYGSRFKRSDVRVPFITRAANWALTWLTNILYGSRLTDMETAYKAFTRRAAMDLQLESRGFEIEPEITAKFLRRGVPIHEVPIAYSPRTSREGKKMRWRDGFTAIRTLLRYRWRT